MSEHSKGNLTTAIYRDDPLKPPTVQQMKDFVCAIIDKTIEHGESDPDFYMVMLSMDKDDPVSMAVIGNGPHSRANAERLALTWNSHDELFRTLKAAGHALRSFQYGNVSEELAKEIADSVDSALAAAEAKP